MYYYYVYMEILQTLLSIVQSMSISLGVGCSTVAIVSFFVAIADGTIEPAERRILGVTYMLLRIAMITILVTTVLLSIFHLISEYRNNFIPFMLSHWFLVSILFVNATLMTKHIMPTSVGPALQAATWYALGVSMALMTLSLADYTFFDFFVGYLAFLALGIAVVNIVMAYLKRHPATGV